MRIWLNPDRMRAYNVLPDEVMEALNDQSIIGKAGRIGRGDSKQAGSIGGCFNYSHRSNDPTQLKM